MNNIIGQDEEHHVYEWAATINRVQGPEAAADFLREQGYDETTDITTALQKFTRQAQSDETVMAFKERWQESSGMTEEQATAAIQILESLVANRSRIPGHPMFGMTTGEYIKTFIEPEMVSQDIQRLLVAPEEEQPIIGTTAFDDTEVPVVEIPVDTLDLSKDVPNFKEGADLSGVIEPLQAEKYERLGTAPIVVWERHDGSLEVITGRHRLDLARRTGEKTIPAQIVKESEGFTKEQAMIFDAEANIRDGQGSVRDYANYFRQTGITVQEASRRGLLSRVKGRRGFAIGAYASDGLYTLFRNGKIGEQKAAAIATAAPNNEAVQDLGIKKAKELTAEELEQYVKILSQAKPREQAEQGNLFGEDESFILEAERIARAAAAKMRELKGEYTTLKKALTLGDKARSDMLSRYGFQAGDRVAINERIEELEQEIAEWENWETDSEKIDELRNPPGGPDTLFQRTAPSGFSSMQWGAVDRYLATRKDGRAVREKLDRFKDTAYGKQLGAAILTRAAIQDLLNGKAVAYDNLLTQIRKSTGKPFGDRLINNIRRYGEEGLLKWIRSRVSGGWFGRPAKPGVALNGSFLSCDPSWACAEFCYAARDNYIQPMCFLPRKRPL